MSSPLALRRACKLTLEALETRCLLSASLVRDITPGPGSSNFVAPVGFNDRLFFGIREGAGMNQTSAFWGSDGTEEGTVVVHNLNRELINNVRAGEFVYFTIAWNPPATTATQLAVYRSDGAGADPVHRGAGRAGSTSIGNLTVAGDRYFFSTTIRVPPAGPLRVSLYEGTSVQSPRVILSRTSNTGLSVGNLAPTSQGLFFTTDFTMGAGVELHYYVPGVGVRLVQDIFPGIGASRPSNLTVIDDVLYFVADDGAHGRELWRSDGTAEGTYLLKDINPGPAGAFGESVGFLTSINGMLYFSADDGQNGVELWKSDGTEEGTALVADIYAGPEGSFAAQFVEYNGLAVFAALTAEHGYELWASNGTAEGTYRITDINPGPAGSFPDKPVVHNGLLYFSAEEGEFGRELWASDGTAEGTFLAADVRPGVEGSDPLRLTSTGGILFFTANDGNSGVELWKLDGRFSPGPGGSDGPGLVAALMGRSEAARPVALPALVPVGNARPVVPELGERFPQGDASADGQAVRKEMPVAARLGDFDLPELDVLA